MKKKVFLTSVCVVFALQCCAALVLWAACPENCTCTKPKAKACLDKSMSCVDATTQSDCSSQRRTGSISSPLIASEGTSDETNVQTDTDHNNKVLCYTYYPCIWRLQNNSSDTYGCSPDLDAASKTELVNPLKAVSCD